MARHDPYTLTKVFPGPWNAAPDTESVALHMETWLEDHIYGYRPRGMWLKPCGWSTGWEVNGRVSSGWKFELHVPEHVGPALLVEARRSA